MDIIHQLREHLSLELWIEFQVQKNIAKKQVKKEMNKMIDDAFKNMSSNFEANFQDVVTRSLNKLTSSGLSHDEDVDNLPDNEQVNAKANDATAVVTENNTIVDKNTEAASQAEKKP